MSWDPKRRLHYMTVRQFRSALIQAYQAGFDTSAEGYNGEVCTDPEEKQDIAARSALWAIVHENKQREGW